MTELCPNPNAPAWLSFKSKYGIRANKWWSELEGNIDDNGIPLEREVPSSLFLTLQQAINDTGNSNRVDELLNSTGYKSNEDLAMYLYIGNKGKSVGNVLTDLSLSNPEVKKQTETVLLNPQTITPEIKLKQLLSKYKKKGSTETTRIDEQQYVSVLKDVNAYNKEYGNLVLNLYKAPNGSYYIKINQDNIQPKKGNKGLSDPDLRMKYFPKSTTRKTSEILNDIGKSNHPLNKVAQKLKTYAKINDVNISLVPEIVLQKGDVQTKAAGVFRTTTNEIHINENATFKGVGSEPTILHEILHALTVGYLRESQGQNKTINNFEMLYTQAKNNLLDKNLYALKNIKEFTVALFTDSTFIKELQNVPPIKIKKYANLFEEVFDYILSLFKFSKTNETLYNQAFAVATNILQEQLDEVNRVDSLNNLYENIPVGEEVYLDEEVESVSNVNYPITNEIRNAQQWIKSIMPNANIELVNDLIADIGKGSYDTVTDLITLSKKFADKTTAKHEVFHAAFNRLSKEKQEELLNEGSKLFGIPRGKSKVRVKYSELKSSTKITTLGINIEEEFNENYWKNVYKQVKIVSRFSKELDKISNAFKPDEYYSYHGTREFEIDDSGNLILNTSTNFDNIKALSLTNIPVVAFDYSLRKGDYLIPDIKDLEKAEQNLSKGREKLKYVILKISNDALKNVKLQQENNEEYSTNERLIIPKDKYEIITNQSLEELNAIKLKQHWESLSEIEKHNLFENKKEKLKEMLIGNIEKSLKSYTEIESKKERIKNYIERLIFLKNKEYDDLIMSERSEYFSGGSDKISKEELAQNIYFDTIEEYLYYISELENDSNEKEVILNLLKPLLKNLSENDILSYFQNENIQVFSYWDDELRPHYKSLEESEFIPNILRWAENTNLNEDLILKNPFKSEKEIKEIAAKKKLKEKEEDWMPFQTDMFSYEGDLAIEEKIAEMMENTPDEKLPKTKLGKWIQSIRNFFRNLFKEKTKIERLLRDINQGRFKDKQIQTKITGKKYPQPQNPITPSKNDYKLPESTIRGRLVSLLHLKEKLFKNAINAKYRDSIKLVENVLFEDINIKYSDVLGIQDGKIIINKDKLSLDIPLETYKDLAILYDYLNDKTIFNQIKDILPNSQNIPLNILVKQLNSIIKTNYTMFPEKLKIQNKAIDIFKQYNSLYNNMINQNSNSLLEMYQNKELLNSLSKIEQEQIKKYLANTETVKELDIIHIKNQLKNKVEVVCS